MAAPAAHPRMVSGAIQVRSACLSYGGRTIFEGLDLTVETGIWTGLLGTSGIGKTSLIRAIAGLPMDSGTLSGMISYPAVSESGQRPDSTPQIAYMAQRDMLMPWLTILDNVLIGTRLRGHVPTLPDREQALELLAHVGLAGWADARPAALSGGMRQRAALARTLMEDRAIILMDEPFSALDAVTRMRLQDLATDLLEGRTILLVTHDPTEALRLCDRIFLMGGTPPHLTGFAEIPDLPRPRNAADAAIARAAGAIFERLAA